MSDAAGDVVVDGGSIGADVRSVSTSRRSMNSSSTRRGRSSRARAPHPYANGENGERREDDGFEHGVNQEWEWRVGHLKYASA
jgi:hypothetical protein